VFVGGQNGVDAAVKSLVRMWAASRRRHIKNVITALEAAAQA